jgi:drug/metabolite transporter (DMT)-like permease
MAYFLALASALLYGAGDFVGGITARRSSTLAAVLVSQAAGLLLLGLMLPLLPAAALHGGDLLWGGVAGLFGGAGVGLLYGALAIGTMAVVAPVTAVCAVAIPVIAGVVLGDRLTAVSVGGILLAMLAIVLVSQTPAAAPITGQRTGMLPPGVGQALCSGVAIGLFFLALARTGREAGLWPLLAARSASVLVFGAIALVSRASLRMTSATLLLATGGGALDMVANALYLIATRYGALSGVVTLASLYPASTVVLARVVLGERLSRIQLAGIACAFVAVVMIVGA